MGEVTLVRASRKKVRELRRRKEGPLSKAFLSLLEDPEGSFATLRLGSMASLAVAAVSVSALLPRGSPLLAAAGGLGAAAACFLLEIVPRSIAASAPERWGLRLGPILLLWKAIFAPAARLVGSGLDRLLAPLGIRAHFRAPDPAVEEVERILAEAGDDRGGPSPELLRSLFDLPLLLTKDVLIPRTEVVAIPASVSREDLVRLIARERHSHYPVYRGTIDTIVGVLSTTEILPALQGDGPLDVSDFVRPAAFVPWALRLDKLLRRMREEGLRAVMVSDEHGGLLGMVTLEDVVTKILAGLGSAPSVSFQPLEDGSHLLDGSTPLSRANVLLAADFPSDEGFETIGGFLVHLAGTIPEADAELESHGFRFTVIERTPTRVVRIRVRSKALEESLGAA